MPPLATRHSPHVTHNGATTASLWDSLRTQLRVIGALLMREILTRYGRKNIGFLWLFIDPMLVSLSIALIVSFVRVRHFETVPIFAFILVSYATTPLWRRSTARCMNAFSPNKQLLYHRQVAVIDFYLTRVLLEHAGATMAFVCLVLLFALFSMVPLPLDPLQVAAGWFMIAWFGFGLSLLVGSLVHRAPLMQKLWVPTSMLLFLCSAVIYPVDTLPHAARYYVLLLPMTNGIEYLREGYFGPVMTYYYHMWFMAVCNTALTALGLLSVWLLKDRMGAD
jgi:ABC-type polysaccharide/polyol phosphate export permease